MILMFLERGERIGAEKGGGGLGLAEEDLVVEQGNLVY